MFMTNEQLVKNLNFKEKVERSLQMIGEARERYGKKLVVANSLGKDSCVVWDLAKRVSADIRGFIVTTRFKPKETKMFMRDVVFRYPELTVYESHEEVDDGLHLSKPDECCRVLKVEPTRLALEEHDAECWVTGLRCTEGEVRKDLREHQFLDFDLEKLNPILCWTEREVWQYLALYHVPVNPLYREGYRSLGCAPCSAIITSGEKDERWGRWKNTPKIGGECGIHTRPLK